MFKIFVKMFQLEPSYSSGGGIFILKVISSQEQLLLWGCCFIGKYFWWAVKLKLQQYFSLQKMKHLVEFLEFDNSDH